jgi:hypothetical protein
MIQSSPISEPYWHSVVHGGDASGAVVATDFTSVDADYDNGTGALHS